MLCSKYSTRRGFTLVELAIVLAIAGVLFVGLWRLMSGGNAQVRDQNAATQQLQLINAVKGYLASPAGQTQMKAVAASTAFAIALPTSNTSLANCQANDAANPGLCSYLPLGFTGAGAATPTVNSYNQTYQIEGLKDSSAAGTVPQSYSFVIQTNGGDTIPDSSGGRIASSIGSDGGFIYSSNVCGLPIANFACGAYGTWSSNVVATYGLPGGSGHIASLSFISTSGATSTIPWLERNTSLTPDPNFLYNTMNANLFMGDASTGAAGPTTFYLSSYAESLVVPPASNNNLNIEGGTISDLSLKGNISIVTPGPIATSYRATGTGTVPLTLGTNCTQVNPSPDPAHLTYIATCDATLQANGDVSVLGELVAAESFSGEFYYNSDIRLKKDIVPLKNSMDDVLKLKPVNYILRASNHKNIGFIAQDVEKIYPELVSTDPRGMKAVNYMGLVAPLVSAVQELKQENDDLRNQLNEQQKQQQLLMKYFHQEKAD